MLYAIRQYIKREVGVIVVWVSNAFAQLGPLKWKWDQLVRALSAKIVIFVTHKNYQI
jgi:hypothetical protein